MEQNEENIYTTEIRGVPVTILNPDSLTPDEIKWVLKDVKKTIIKFDSEQGRSVLN